MSGQTAESKNGVIPNISPVTYQKVVSNLLSNLLIIINKLLIIHMNLCIITENYQ